MVASSELVAANLDGEVVILGFKSGSYFGLDHVGALVWELIQEPRRIADIRDRILDEYDIDPARCEQDLHNLFGDLLDKGLVVIQMETAA